MTDTTREIRLASRPDGEPAPDNFELAEAPLPEPAVGEVFAREVGGYVASGELRYRETVVDGIERMPEAFIGLLRGDNTGKMLVRVGPDPS